MAGQAPHSPPPIGHSALDAAAALAVDDDDAAAAMQDPSVMAGSPFFPTDVPPQRSRQHCRRRSQGRRRHRRGRARPFSTDGPCSARQSRSRSSRQRRRARCRFRRRGPPVSEMDKADEFRSLCEVIGINLKQKIIDEVML
ncbi:hypothetical protein ACP70R_040545 [Stipagrostis hirtigluma subsp. patula]